MPREFQQDGDLSFQGFQTFPNSAAFDPNAGILEYIENMRIDEGVLRPRQGALLHATTGVTCTHATAGHGVDDAIYLWGSDGKVRRVPTMTTTPTITQLPTANRAYLPVGGLGYTKPAAIEAAEAASWSGDYNFTSAEYVLGRLAYAKNDQIWFSLYGGVQPFNPDTLSLVQGTYDPITALHWSDTTRQLIALGKRSMYKIQLALPAVTASDKPPTQDHFHNVQLLSAHEGCIAPDSVDETGSHIFFMGYNGVYALTLDYKWSEGQGPASLPLHNYFENRDPAILQKASGAASNGRYHLSFADVGSTENNKVLVINPLLKNLFESIDVYPVGFKHLVTCRYVDGIPHVFGVTADGRVFVLQANSTDNGTTIVSKFRTRNYIFKTHLDKRFDSVSVHMDTNGFVETDINFITVNPDSTSTIDKVSGNLGTTVRRALAAKKSMGGKVEVVVNSGRPAFYSVMVDASVSGRSIFSVF